MAGDFFRYHGRMATRLVHARWLRPLATDRVPTGRDAPTLARVLQPPTTRERAALAGRDLPFRIGPPEFGAFGALVARCPQDLDHLTRTAGGMWETASRRWLIGRHCIGPLIRNLRHVTELLFRRAGMNLDDRA